VNKQRTKKVALSFGSVIFILYIYIVTLKLYIMMSGRQIEVTEFLESLVGQRFNMETLNATLTSHFGEEIKAEIVNDDDESNELSDWDIMFDSLQPDTYGYFDIYVLKMRRPGFDGSEFYVTEVAYEFE
jgi:hypothetical protein